MYRNILLASDGSEDALRAARAAAALARRFGAALTVLHVYVIPPSVVALYGVPGTGMDPGSLLQMEDAAHNAVMQRTGEVLDQEGVTYSTAGEIGHPAEVIARLARDRGCDLIVLGSRGLSGVRSFLLGSVSDRVAHHAPCSVLIVKQAAEEFNP
jgi:nucleotide-binding universal stress UspA family protein